VGTKNGPASWRAHYLRFDDQSSSSSSFLVTTRISVVSTRPAIEAALASAERSADDLA